MRDGSSLLQVVVSRNKFHSRHKCIDLAVIIAEALVVTYCPSSTPFALGQLVQQLVGVDFLSARLLFQ